jgi:pimeloyl-ACP methyl ester carboxylesterase
MVEIERGLVATSFGQVHYRTAGRGPVIIMLHMSHRSSSMFLETMEHFAGEYRCLAIDLPGCGDSDRPEQRMGVPEYAVAVLDVLDGLGVTRPIVMGQAIGAAIAIELAGQHPDRVGSLIIQSCPFYRDTGHARERHSIVRSAYETDPSGFPRLRSMQDVIDRDLIHAPFRPTQEWLDRENVDLAKAGRRFVEMLTATTGWDRAAAVERVRCPTLLIWGESFIYADAREEFTKRLTDSNVVLIPNAGLFIQIDNTEFYERAVRDYLEALPNREGD